MTTNTFPITVQALPTYTGLDGTNADNYYRARQRTALLSSEVVSPFREALKDSAGYTDANIPDRELEIAKDLGELRFVMKVTPTKKRPGYKDVFDELDGYLRARLTEYKAGNRPVGVFTFDGQPYISANDVLARLKKTRSKVTAEGVKVEISDPDFPTGVDSVVVPLGMDLRQLTEGNARRYLQAASLADDFGDIIGAFEEELLGLTGFSNEHLPEQTEHLYRQLGNHIFHVASIPYPSTGYGKVVEGLDKEPGKKPESGGDLILVTHGVEIPRLRTYDARGKDGDTLVKLNGLLNRMDKLVEENTEVKLRQRPINHYPVA